MTNQSILTAAFPDVPESMRKFQEQADAAYREFVRKEHEEWLKRVFT